MQWWSSCYFRTGLILYSTSCNSSVETRQLAGFGLIIILFSGLFPILDVKTAAPNVPTGGTPSETIPTISWAVPSAGPAVNDYEKRILEDLTKTAMYEIF